MSPSKFEDGTEVTKGVINGPLPTPLRINKESHVIHKTSSSNSSSSSHQPSVVDSISSKHHQSSPVAKRQPVIIYTHSPKVIHAQARDFMALVQKLTGLSRSDQDEKTTTQQQVKSESTESTRDDGSFSGEIKDCVINNYKNGGSGSSYDQDNESSSVLTDEKFVGGVKQDSSVVSPMYKVSSNPYLVDAPLFTPNNSNEFFCSPRPDSMFQSPNIANSISPSSFMDIMRGFPEC